MSFQHDTPAVRCCFVAAVVGGEWLHMAEPDLRGGMVWKLLDRLPLSPPVRMDDHGPDQDHHEDLDEEGDDG